MSSISTGVDKFTICEFSPAATPATWLHILALMADERRLSLAWVQDRCFTYHLWRCFEVVSQFLKSQVGPVVTPDPWAGGGRGTVE
jgi:hypothetical protein